MAKERDIKLVVLAFLAVVFIALLGTAAVVVVNRNDGRQFIRLPGSPSRIEEAARNSFRRAQMPTRDATVKPPVASGDGWDVHFYFPEDRHTWMKWVVHVTEKNGEYQAGEPRGLGLVVD